MMSERFTSNGEGHRGSDLPLEAVGGDACVVASVAAGNFGEVELAVPLVHAWRQLSSICRKRQREAQWGSGGLSLVLHVEVVKSTPLGPTQMKQEMIHDDESSSPSVYCAFCFLSFVIISMKRT